MYSIGEIIATKREEMHLSQGQLAELLAKETGISISNKTVSAWEKNRSEPNVTTFYRLCKLLSITNMYEAYYGMNPDDPFNRLNDDGIAKVMEFIELLHATHLYEKASAKIIPFLREIHIFENAVSAGTGNFLTDGPYTTIRVMEDALPEDSDFGVIISGDSMEPVYSNGHIAWVHKQDYVEHGEIGIFSLNGDAYIKKLQDDENGVFLISLNKKYPPIPVGENDVLHTFGKVVGNCNKTDFEEFRR